MLRSLSRYRSLWILLIAIGCVLGWRIYHIYQTNQQRALRLEQQLSTGSLAIIVPEAKSQVSCNTSAFIAPLFAPHDAITAQLLKYIQEEQQQIDCAVFMITDSIIAQALLNAHHRGVHVRILVDASMLDSTQQQALKLLQKTGNLRIYQSDFDGIMHHKFALFYKVQGKKILWTGSFNWTKRAQAANQENAHVFMPLYRDALAVPKDISLRKVRRHSQLRTLGAMR